ncbi:hypothetical protein DFA_06537 [Cavenderia fasciculata]|uniref:Uncharacterized protein n=1 Tax=Cavenderia fasciculata TaxID=261658 RepID=F4PJA1_CACFS|nr:uncharacterized protein DFA_06537 [Cavenderia fasciculata]EGG24387.1 hypothetical protein DFA_06537 [Cavenderia fasciculata]|eukprot:XP_004362238.1 hypothetical protein DFA_06537 [Cavenderia fasciculata]
MNNNNNNIDNQQQQQITLPTTITRIIIDLLLCCGREDGTSKWLIEDSLNLSRVSKRWLKITSSVFVQYYTLRLQSNGVDSNINYIKRLQQNIQSPFCLLYHQALTKVELVFGYDYTQIAYILHIQKLDLPNRITQLKHASQFSDLKVQIEFEHLQPTGIPIKPKPRQSYEIKYSINRDRQLLKGFQNLDILSIDSSTRVIIDKQSAIYNQLVQLFTNREVFGQITTLELFTYDEIDVDVLIPIVQQGGNQLTTLFLDGPYNQKVCQVLLPLAMNLSTLAYRDGLDDKLGEYNQTTNNINLNNNDNKEENYFLKLIENNNNSLERLYLVTTDINILNNIFISGGGLIFNNLKFLQIPSCHLPFMSWSYFKVSLPLLEVIKIKDGIKQNRRDDIIPINVHTFPPIIYHPSLLGLKLKCSMIPNDLLRIDPLKYIPFTTLKSLTLKLNGLGSTIPYLDRFEQLETLVISISEENGTSPEFQLLCQDISKIKSLVSLDLLSLNQFDGENLQDPNLKINGY